MPLPAHSPEFARLATRWLEGAATAAEARQLFESVQADKACAKEFADQARFELLLQDTLRERLKEQGIAAGARQQTVKYHRRATVRRVLAVAAVVVATGCLLWLVLPAGQNTGTSVPEVTQAPAPDPLPLPRSMPTATKVLMAREDPATPPTEDPPEPLRKQLDQFFLTGVDLDKVPLSRAIKQLEDQLRELNFDSKAELAALHVQFPPGAGSQPVTFHCGSISFLKAVRALAALAGYDVNADDSSVALVTRSDGNPLRVESRSLDSLLTQFGNPGGVNRDRMAELFNDARSLGINVGRDGQGGDSTTSLNATPGQFEALALMAQSRDQIRGMPPLYFYMRASRSQPGAQSRILTGQEAEAARSEFEQSIGANQLPVITVPLLESMPSALPEGPIVVGATPVGRKKVYLSVTPGSPPPSQPQHKSSPVVPDPQLALVDSSNGAGTPEVIQMQLRGSTTPTDGNLTKSGGGVVVLTSGSVGGLADVAINTGTLSVSGTNALGAGTSVLNNALTSQLSELGQALTALAASGGIPKGNYSFSNNVYTATLLSVNGNVMVTAGTLPEFITQLEFFRASNPPP